MLTPVVCFKQKADVTSDDSSELERPVACGS